MSKLSDALRFEREINAENIEKYLELPRLTQEPESLIDFIGNKLAAGKAKAKLAQNKAEEEKSFQKEIAALLTKMEDLRVRVAKSREGDA